MTMSRGWGFAALGVIGLAAVDVAIAQNQEGMWHATPFLQGILLDSDRERSDGYGGALAFGYSLSDRWSIEASIGRSEHDGAADNDLTIGTAGISVLGSFRPHARISPYVIAGAGAIRTEPRFRTIFEGTVSDPYAELGLGVLIGVASVNESTRQLSVRAEMRGRRAFADGADDPVDGVASLGIQFSWGGRPQRAAEAAPPSPAPTPMEPTDGDGDGVTDHHDRCPETPPGVRVDASGCPIDSDMDGVPNSDDRCPDTPEGERVDANGCPFREEIRLDNVHFETNSDVLRPESRSTLDYAVRTLARNPDLTIEVAGHTDSRGSVAFNQDLSQRRAESVLRYLREHGVRNPLTARGYGESQPMADNATDEGRQRNRRVGLRVMPRPNP